MPTVTQRRWLRAVKRLQVIHTSAFYALLLTIYITKGLRITSTKPVKRKDVNMKAVSVNMS